MTEPNRHYYDTFGEQYDSSSWYQLHKGKLRDLDRDIDRIVSRLSPNAHVLELGAGTGFITERFLRRMTSIGDWHAVDHSETMIKLARIRLKDDLASEHLTLQCAEVQDFLRTDGRQFDLVVLHSIVHHVADWYEFLSLVRSVTKPGGLVFLRREPIASVGMKHRSVLGSVLASAYRLIDAVSLQLYRSGITYRVKRAQPSASAAAIHLFAGGLNSSEISCGFLSNGWRQVWSYEYNAHLSSVAYFLDNHLLRKFSKDDQGFRFVSSLYQNGGDR